MKTLLCIAVPLVALSICAAVAAVWPLIRKRGKFDDSEF